MTDDQIKAIFFDAVDLDPDDREALIAARSGGDPAIERRVHDLLGAHDGAGDFMKEPTAGAIVEATATERDEDAPDRIGPYVIERTLGEGGYGTVYLARQTEPVQRTVALKVIKPGMDTRQVVLRFEPERQTPALMDHPSIARVLDAGTTGTGRPYFVMERVQGETITAYCDRRRLPLRDRLRLFEQVCHAVQHAHQKGIIHRDLKPTNVLVTEIDGGPMPKVIDFGIAKALEGDAASPAITQTLQVIGTPQYMSPEQALAGACVDTRSDVYSLGVILYEMLAGVPPYEGERLRSASFAEIERIIRVEIPPRPSSRLGALDEPDRREIAADRHAEPARLVRDLRGELDWIVMRALEKEPARRYPTAYALGSDVDRFLRNVPVEAGPPSRTYRMAKFAMRHRVSLAVALAMALVVSVLLVGSVVFGIKAERQRRSAEHQLVRADALSEFAQSIIMGVDPAVARAEDTALLRRLLDDAARRVSAELHDQPEAAVSMLITIGVAYQRIAEFDEALRVLSEAARRARTEIGRTHPLTLDAEASLGAIHLERSEFEEAERLIHELLRTRTQIQGPDHPETLEARSTLAYLYRQTGRYAQALAVWEEVLERRRRVLGPDHEDTIATMNAVATTMSSLGDEAGSLALLHEVLAHQVRVDGEDHPRTLATMNNIADTELDLGRLDDAERMFRRVLDVKRTVLPANHPSLVITMNNLAHVYLRSEHHEEAASILRRALDAARAGAGDPHMITLTVKNSLATAERRLGRHDEADELLRSALDDIRELSPNHPHECVIIASLARLYVDMDRVDEALAFAEEADRLAAERLPASASRRVGIELVRAEVLAGAGRHDDAEASLHDIRRRCVESLGPDHPRVAETDDALTRLAERRAGVLDVASRSD